jgi:glycosyltransferase involved in cell wall biosynthesis
LKFLFITSSNIACNPRLFKELQLALKLGHSCSVIQFKLGNWTDSKTNLLKKSLHNVQFIEFTALRNPFFQWFYTSLIQKILSFLPQTNLPIRLLAFSLSKRSIIINRFLKNNWGQYDWVIAHNPPSFYPALVFSLKIRAKLGIDIEDYHPGETNDLKESRKMLRMMKMILPKADYCSFAAPLIKEEVQKFITHESNEWVTILNGFAKDEFNEPTEIKYKKLKVVWFSQNIAPGRGLEKFISLANKLHKEIELHLVGDLSEDHKNLLLKCSKGVFIHLPMTQRELHGFLSQFDVGLAVETSKDLNNSIAVSNKILAYVQSGLYVIATPTPGQLSFLVGSNLNFSIVHLSDIEIEKCFSKLIKDKPKLIHKELQFQRAKKFSWENINESLINIWEN